MKIAVNLFDMSNKFCKNHTDFLSFGLYDTPIETDMINVDTKVFSYINPYTKMIVKRTLKRTTIAVFHFKELVIFEPKKLWLFPKSSYRYPQIYLIHANNRRAK